MKLKFGSYHKEEWIYDKDLGVGLDFFGYPTDIPEFFEILTGASCNEIAAQRILDTLKLNRHKQVTVTAQLFFEQIGDDLKKIEVEMKIIPPFIYSNPQHIENNYQIDATVLAHLKGKKEEYFVKNFTVEQKEEVQKRINQTRIGMEQSKIHTNFKF